MKFVSLVKIILSPILFIVGVGYAAAMILRNFLYDIGILKAYSVSVPVVSVGNITAGGTGKTPITAFLVESLKKDNLKIGIISRGYGGSYREPFVRVDSRLAEASQIFGDEPTWFAQSLKDVRVWVGDNKVETAKALLESSPATQIIFADDAFQHRRLKRDIDVVIIDATASIFDYLPIPLGRGREDFYLGVRRADILVLNKVNLVTPEKATRIKHRLELLKTKKTILVEAKSTIVDFRFLNSDQTLIPQVLREKPIYLASGIARPEQFFQLVQNSTLAQMKGHYILRDHSPYDPMTIKKIEGLAQKAFAEYIVVTEKDAVKLSGVETQIPILVSRLKLSAPELARVVSSRIHR